MRGVVTPRLGLETWHQQGEGFVGNGPMLELEVASRVPVTTAEGPGRRFGLWVQGCALRCPGCCNPQLFARGRGQRIPVPALLDEIVAAAREHDLEGMTVLGGEPLEQLPALAALCRGLGAAGLGVLVFTGYTLVEARARPGFEALWRHVDTLVDGRYDRERPEPRQMDGGRRFIGSANQRLHHRTSRYCDPALWRGPARIEVHLDQVGGLTAHGEPDTLAALLGALRSARRP